MLDSTRQFIQAMDAKDIKHSDIEVTQSGMEKVTVIYTGDSIPSIRMIFFFNKDKFSSVNSGLVVADNKIASIRSAKTSGCSLSPPISAKWKLRSKLKS